MKKQNTNTPDTANGVLHAVIWRNWLLPFIICLFVAVFFRVIFHYLPENSVTTDFLAGWISCMAWYISRKYYAI